MNKIQKSLIEKGCCDERGAGFAANADLLPNGTWGLVLLCVKGNDLLVYETNARTEPGRLLSRIPLCAVEELSIHGLLIKKLSFTYKGFLYSFDNLIGLKKPLSVIEEEAGV